MINHKVKHRNHQLLDSIWSIVPARRQFRSLLYQLWGGVLACELHDVTGVVNPRIGNQHMSTMEAEHQNKFPGYIQFLINNYHNVNHLHAHLIHWQKALQTHVLNPPYSDDKEKSSAIQSWLNKDTLVQNIRTHLTISRDSEPTSCVTASQPTVTPILSAEDHYMNGLVAEIDGRSYEKISHFEHASSLGHAEASWQLLPLAMNQSPPDYERGMELMDRAVAQGHQAARYQQQNLYWQRIVTPAIETLEQQATQPDMNDPALLHRYALFLLETIPLENKNEAEKVKAMGIKAEHYLKTAMALSPVGSTLHHRIHSCLVEHYVASKISCSKETYEESLTALNHYATQEQVETAIMMLASYILHHEGVKSSVDSKIRIVALFDKLSSPEAERHKNFFIYKHFSATSSERKASIAYLEKDASSMHPLTLLYLAEIRASEHNHQEALHWINLSSWVDHRMKVMNDFDADRWTRRDLQREADRSALLKLSGLIDNNRKNAPMLKLYCGKVQEIKDRKYLADTPKIPAKKFAGKKQMLQIAQPLIMNDLTQEIVGKYYFDSHMNELIRKIKDKMAKITIEETDAKHSHISSARSGKSNTR